MGILLLPDAGAEAQYRLPILDMHMHARTAAFYGPPPLPICAPVERMPRWDQRKPMWEDGSPPPCSEPLLSPATDAEHGHQRGDAPGVLPLLRGIVEAGYGDRVMFGSDQIIWPGLIDAAVRSIEEARFLTSEQKRDVFYNNAARFLRLGPEEIARHHGSSAAAAATRPPPRGPQKQKQLLPPPELPKRGLTTLLKIDPKV